MRGLCFVFTSAVPRAAFDRRALRDHDREKMSTRGIRRKKSSLSEVKVAVIGAPSVGKSGTCS